MIRKMVKRIVILVAQSFQDEEFIYAYYRLLEECFKVDIATPGGEVMMGKFGVPARANLAIENITNDYDGVVLPGGFESPDRLRMRVDVQEFVNSMNAKNKLIAAICHAPSILISSHVVRGKRITGYDSIIPDIKSSGAIYTNLPVVIDGNIITSPHYKNNGHFMKAVVDYLNG